MNGRTEHYIEALLVEAERTAVITRIASSLGSFRGKALEVARFILEEADRIDAMTIESIADRFQTSRATIQRVCKDLGYRNFTELRKELGPANGEDFRARSLNDLAPNRRMIAEATKRFISAVLDTFSVTDMDRIHEAAQMILQHSPYTIYGGSLSAAVARITFGRLRRIGVPGAYSSDTEEVRADLEASTRLLICVSHMDANTNVLRLLSLAQQMRVPTILMTNADGTPVCRQADLVLKAGIVHHPSTGDEIWSRASYLLLADLLCEEIARLKSEPQKALG